MTKRTSKSKPKTIRRTSTMVKVVAEGESFLKATEKKRIRRTATMAATIKEANSLLARKPKKTVKKPSKTDDSRSPSSQPDKKKGKKIAKGKNSKKPTKKTTSVKGGDKKNGSLKNSGGSRKKNTQKSGSGGPKDAPIIPPPALPANFKKTILKSNSKDNLPLPAFGFIDVCFCIDTTGSMSYQIAQAQSTILSIISNIQSKVSTEGLTLRFAVVAYRDHPLSTNQYVVQSLDFTDGHEAGQYTKKLTAFGGGDFPEAVHDGLLHCCKGLNWVQLPNTPVLRYIFHIADAPPHGTTFGNVMDKQQGCSCGIKTKQVFHEVNLKQIHFRLIKARSGSQLDVMQNVFRKGFVDFDCTDLGHAKEMNVKVSDMIIHEVLPDFA